ncbi:putative sulfinoalanine decarboxylase [Danaus plexippus plexippus]|uniref:Sulfinoalanine decarboxylase n=1 Tax=Danaus plexippus plexippus TaxID=278856 RepID=A0A212EIC8_DANPL|nr:putative sulfinoalanine decarboxylase [Danaus plexippus plexippus]
MDTKGHSFLDRVFNILKDETADEVPLIQFKHPKELEEILSNDLDISINVDDKELENSVRKILQYSVKTNKVTFRNQLYGPMDPYGLAGTWIAEAFNTSQYTFEVAPVFTLIELKMIEHILKLFGIPGGDGIFSPGGSVSMLYALVAARFKKFPEVKSKGMQKLPEMTIFTSEDSHYSIIKAAHWLGFGTESVISIKTNSSGQMIVNELNKAIERQLGLGKYPVFVNATAGTTVLGAIDDLEAIASVCKKYDIWMHVDACWGGGLMLSATLRKRLQGIQFADSISWNPHKMIGAPLQCSIFLLKEKGLLHEANAAAAQYLFQQDKFYDVRYDTGDKSVQCGRKIDSFKLWMMWKARGDIGLCKVMDHVMSISEFCLRSIAEREGFRLVSDTLQCPNICFWYIPVFMRKREENDEWWALIHKITPKLKELLTLSSRLMIAYTPLRHHKNFFRLAFTFHPVLEENHVLEILKSIEECGEMVNTDMV